MNRALVFAGASLVGLALFFSAAAEPATQSLQIHTASGVHAYQVEVAADEQSREHGLMDRSQMPADHGMLFEFPTRAPVTFWMKNTHISLDMIFIDKDGTVAGVAARATPMSEALIRSNAPVVAVLELNAGQAAEIGLKRGDKVKFPFFH